MKSLRLFFSSGRSFVAATLLIVALLCCTMAAARADQTVKVLDTGIDTATGLSLIPASPRTFVGSPFSLGTAAGTTNIPINGGTVYLATTTATTYTALQATIYFWGTVNTGTVSASAPAFSNLLGTITLDGGALTSSVNAIYDFDFTLTSPVVIPTRTLGITVAWKGDSGAGLVLTDNLTSVIRSGPAFPVGAGLANAFYFNSSGEVNGNFITGLKTFTGRTNQGLTIDLTALAVTPVISSFSPTSGPVGTSVVITGTGFGGVTSVTFNGIATTSFTVNSPTQITATVPTGATSGVISVTTAGGTATSADSFTVTPPSPSTALQGAVINEFRLGGPSGASDEFIELYNQGNTPIDLTGWSLTAGAVTVTISSGKVIKPYGRLLLTGSGYSLANYGGTGAASGDVAYSGDIPLGAKLTLSNAAGTAIDTVNSASLIAPTSATSNYSFVRRMDGTGGAPQDTGADATDFNTVDVASTVGPNNTTGVSSNILRLGAPGPQNLASPIVANQFITFTFANQVRVGSGNGGTLALRYVVANPAGSGRTITALRFRATALTAGTTAVASDGTNSNGPADVRLISSSASGAILPLSLETPPAQANGGGLNSSVSLSGLPAGGIAAGTSVTVEFLFNVVQRGQYRFLLNLEPVTITP